VRGAIPPLPQYDFMAWCLVKHRDNFTFTVDKFAIHNGKYEKLLRTLLMLIVQVMLDCNLDSNGRCVNYLRVDTATGFGYTKLLCDIAWSGKYILICSMELQCIRETGSALCSHT
jgi:hypothetical protein